RSKNIDGHGGRHQRGGPRASKRLEPDGVREQAKENSQTHREVKDVSNKDVKQDALDNLADALTEDILNTPDDELLREVAEDYGDPRALASKFEQILERAEKQVKPLKPGASMHTDAQVKKTGGRLSLEDQR